MINVTDIVVTFKNGERCRQKIVPRGPRAFSCTTAGDCGSVLKSYTTDQENGNTRQ